ncbi:MAG: fasciclin domain-containing protein [Kofleriaceae bacterium]|nr:fasciclin domain-containing protein [Myxococcales bacterium]MCB9560273.1 fasciclin domain-containing protein [Kofleriaceae bacterium]
MTRLASIGVAATLVLGALGACKKDEAAKQAPAAKVEPAAEPPRSNTPPLDPNNIVSIALASKDHTTLVAALKAADYVTAASASGPLTVFAPTNAAFDALPAGTVDNLVKPEHQADLKEILKYHVTTSVLETKDMKDGEVISMANGAKATLHVADDGTVTINDAKIVGSVRASNGIVHVIDHVLLPPAK